MTRVRIRLEVDATRKRAAEADVYVCNAGRFQRLTGWRPKISLERMLHDTLEYWRGRERSTG
jgi:nucleoside-diphosphate-sugar epimerase